MLSYKRSTRVAELLQHEISKIVQEMNNPGIGFVTITGVKLTDDLLDAKVFYSVLGSEEQVAETHNILKDEIPEIRHRIAQTVNLRRTPTLLFAYDSTPEKATKIFELLEKIKDEPSQEPVLPKPAPKPAKKARAGSKKTSKKK